MAYGAVFGEQGGEQWGSDLRRELALHDWRAILEHPAVVVHVEPSGRSSLHRRGVLIAAEGDLDDERLLANLEDLGIPDPRRDQTGSEYQTGPEEQTGPRDQTVRRTGLGFAILPLGPNIDAVGAATFLRSLEGRRPLRVGPDHLIWPSQGGVVGPASPPKPAAPDANQLARRRELAEIRAKVRVAVIDTGLVAGELADPLLAPNQLAAVTTIANPEADPLWDGGQLLHWTGGHGTHVAGVLAEASGGVASIIHFAILVGNGLPVPLVSDSQVGLAVGRALREGCRVINLSLSGPTAADYETIATGLVLGLAAGKVGQTGPRADDAVLVAAAGNDGTSDAQYPAALKGVLGVGALTVDGSNRAPFSNFGAWVDCSAVGEDVFGPYVKGLGGPLPGPGGIQTPFEGWATWSGTSFATPWVAGRIAGRIAQTTSARLAAATVLAEAAPMDPGLGLGVKVI